MGDVPKKLRRRYYNSKLDRWLNDWREDACGNGPASSRFLGETEQGTLLLPSRERADWWDRPFKARNPLHWPYWLRSRRQRNIVMLESQP